MNRLSFMQRCCVLLGIPFISKPELKTIPDSFYHSVPKQIDGLMDGRFRLKAECRQVNISDYYGVPVDLIDMDKVALFVQSPNCNYYEIPIALMENNTIYYKVIFDTPGEWLVQAKFENRQGMFTTSSMIKVTV